MTMDVVGGSMSKLVKELPNSPEKQGVFDLANFSWKVSLVGVSDLNIDEKCRYLGLSVNIKCNIFYLIFDIYLVAPQDQFLMLGELRFSRRTLPRISRSLALLEEVPKSIDPQHQAVKAQCRGGEGVATEPT